MGAGFLSYMVVRVKKKITVIQAAIKILMIYLKKIYKNIKNIREEGIAFTCIKIYIHYICNPNSIVTTIKVLILIYSIVKHITIFDLELLNINPENPGNKRENPEELGGHRKMVRLSGLPDLGLSENAVVNTEL